MPVYLPGLTYGGLGYGGSAYGRGLYGSGAYPRLPVASTGGYGGNPYGTGAYGSLDVIPPKVSGANSIDGFQIEIFFDEEVRENAALLDPANYLFSSLYGVPLEASTVETGTEGVAGGFTSVLVTHTGSTLGGKYRVSVTNIEDLAGNVTLPNSISFSTYGDSTQVLVSLPSEDEGETVLLDFRTSLGGVQLLLTEGEFPGGVEDLGSYEVTTSYPVSPTLEEAIQSVSELSKISLRLRPMTSTTYQLVVGPSLSFDYTGSLLPEDETSFTGTELGTGTSVPTSTEGLLLYKEAGVSYGWGFEDLSGRILPGCSFRADFRVDASASTIVPPLSDATLVTLSVSDGSIQVNLLLEDVSGVKVVSVLSGTLSLQAPASWDLTTCTISLVRNQKGDFYSVLFNGAPLLTFPVADANGAAVYSPGVGVLLSPTPSVSLFSLKKVKLTASSTVYTSSWNFIHGLSTSFLGSSALAVGKVLTRYGPLVRGWGDATPATKADVEVRVAGVPVEIAGVNPYVGEIYPLVPIPKASPGSFTVEIDYIWFSNPSFGLSGLNTPGLTLNTWGHSVGHTSGSLSPLPSNSLGAMRTGRFPMAIALPPLVRPSPKRVGHRYIGYQKQYSALLNQPTTLLLNKNPHLISIGGISTSSIVASGTFNGQTLPVDSETPWELEGVDTGGLVGDGTYRVIDSSTGPYGVGTATVYKRDLDLSLPTSVIEAGRFKVESYVLDGIFTGVSLGVYDGNHLFLLGALVVEGVTHLGVLLNAESPQLEESWEIGPSALAEASSTTTLELDIGSLPPGVTSGSRFRVPEGEQKGVYTIAGCGLVSSDDGSSVTLTFSPELPGNIKLYGNNTFEVLFETPWSSDLVSVRAQIEYPSATASAYLGGSVSGLISVRDSLPAYPAQTALLLPATKKGFAFWGSLSRRAENSTIWDFSFYQSNPERLVNTVHGITVQAEMATTPPEEEENPWYIVGGFGQAQVDSSGIRLLLKSTSASPTGEVDLEYSYERVEPYLTNRVTLDAEAKFRVESGILGAGDAQVFLRDGVREVQFSTLLYTQNGSSRSLVTDQPQVSLSGLQDPTSEGWVESSTFNLTEPYALGESLEITKATDQNGTWNSTLSTPVQSSYEGLITEARFSVSPGYTIGTAGIGLVFGSDVPVAGPGSLVRPVRVLLNSGSIDLADESYTVIDSFTYDWEDELFHTYRLVLDPVADLLVLLVDDVVVGSTPLSGFSSRVGGVLSYFGGVGDGSCTYTLYSTSTVPLRPVAVSGSILARTYGILLRGGDEDNIDSYRIPRADGTSAKNSSLFAIPILMDWRDYSHVRLYLDPAWGVSFYRPDLPPPTWYSGDFTTETTDPTAAWMTVEYALLPVNKMDRGSVKFGATNPRSITQQRWDFFRYRIRGDVDGFGIAPQGMVLNRCYTMTSGEYLNDKTPEIVTVPSRTSTLVYLPDSSRYADRVFVVQVGGTPLASTDWGFDKTTQNLIFNAPLPKAQSLVTVTFSPGRPITKDYLCNQPLESTGTVLNEGTPPVPKSRATSFISEVVTEDPYQFVKFTDPPDSLYANLEFCEIEDGESVHITTLSDGPGPGEGFSEIGLEGEFTSDRTSVPEGPGGPWGKQSPIIRGSATHFNPSSILVSSGGKVLGGVLGPGTAILYPNARGPSRKPVRGMGINQDFRMLLVDIDPREEEFDLPSLMGDNTPPSSADPTTNPNPNGPAGATGHGSVAYMSTEWGLTTYSKLGPWGGLAVLEASSLLSGGTPLGGSEFVLQGGSAIMKPTTTYGFIEAAN